MAWTPAQECAMQLNGRDILVSAAAGSGKTATLTERIIRSLTAADGAPEHGDISRMLIVTFTRAAAAELRSRISNVLGAAIAASEDENLRMRLNDQLLKLGSAHISTIDSFYQETVRANFERLDLPTGFRLADENELTPLKEQLLSRIIDRLYRDSADCEPDPDAPLDALQTNAFALAMDDVLSNRDRGDLAEILLKLYEKLLTFPEELSLLNSSADRLVREAELPVLQTSEGQALKDIYLPALCEVRDILRESPDILAASAKSAENIPLFMHDLAAIEDVIEALEKNDWDRARACILAYAPAGRLTAVRAVDAPPLYARCKKARDDAKTLLLETLPPYFEADAQGCADQMRRTARTGRALYEVLTQFDELLLQEKKRRGAFEFTDMRRFMLRLLQDERGEASDLARTLCGRFDAVYIDEYQDVDAVQDRIFALVGAGGKRFMVGDIKQSIYGFRGSDPSLFTHYKQQFPAVTSVNDPSVCSDGNRIYMSQNFRCDPPVIRFTNDVCSYIFEVCPRSLAYCSTEDDLVPGKEILPKGRIPTPVQVVMLKDPTKAQKAAGDDTLNAEALYVAAEIARLVGHERLANGDTIRPRDIAILSRAEKGAEELVKALSRYGIPTSFAPRVNLAAHPEMTMMVNLLSVIDNPHDDIPLMGLLSCEGSPITLSDVLTMRSNKQSPGSLYDDLCKALADESQGGEEDSPVKHALQALFSLIDHWRALAATLPVDKLLRSIYSHPSLAAMANSPALLAIYDHARTFQNASFCGLYQFLQHFKLILQKPSGLSAAGLEDAEDAVQIMTIHKSKGLEFPVVFLYNCSKQFNHMDERATIVFDRELGIATKQYCPADASMRPSLTRSIIAHRIKEQSHEEEMRILYVALTRARERLYLTAKISKDTEKNADIPTRDNRLAIISASNSFSWVLGALADANRHAPLDPAVVQLTHLDVADILRDAEQIDGAEQRAVHREAPVDAETQYYRDILEHHKTYVDPRMAVRHLPTKAAASKLRVAMLDDVWLAEEFGGEEGENKPRGILANQESSAYIQSRIELMQGAQRPFRELLDAGHRATPAERGTATHLFLQHCDFTALISHSISEELARLVECGKIPQRAADILNREQLAAFVQSELFPLVSNPQSRIWRELRFDRFIPYAHLTRNTALADALQDFTLYVQGSLDLLIEASDGTLWLCDYKTDRIHTGDEDGIRDQLLHDHADQLRIYAEAVNGLFGRRPDHILIYSLPLGRSVELTEYLSWR